MAVKEENLVFTTLDDEKIEFEVIEQTTINGNNYLLVCDAGAPEDQADAYILREKNVTDMALDSSKETEVIYDEVVDDIELQAVAKVFAELLDDCDIQVD